MSLLRLAMIPMLSTLLPTPAQSQEQRPEAAAGVWSLLRVRADSENPFAPNQSIQESPALSVWRGGLLTIAVDEGAAAMWADQSGCGAEFEVCLRRDDGTAGSACIDQGTFGYAGKNTKPGGELHVGWPLRGLTDTRAEDDPNKKRGKGFWLKVTANRCGIKETREIAVKQRSVRSRRYDSLDTFIMFEHPQSNKLRPGFATSVTWGLEFSRQCKGLRCSLGKLWNFLDIGVGIHTSLLSFNPGQDASRVEFGAGVAGTVFGGLIVVGYGSNLTTDFGAQRYFFVGTSVSTIVSKAKGIVKPSE